MNHEKAREFFSDYYEGSLDPGLTMSLEQKFKSDPNLRLDYDAFVSAYQQLDAFKAEEIEIPIFLSDRIATRLDEVQLAKRKSIFAWHWNWRSATAAGLAGLAILGAGIGIADKETGVSHGGLLPNIWPFNVGTSHPSSPAPLDAPTFKVTGAHVTVSYSPQAAHTVVESAGDPPQVLRKISMEAGQPIDSELLNNNSAAQLFSLQEDDSQGKELVAVPGSTSDTAPTSGEGTLGQFACAIADAYHIPVLVESQKADQKVKWSLDASTQEALQAATDSLSATHLNIGVRADGMLTIQDR